MEKFVVVDGNSLINRAFYALPNLMTLSKKPCGAVYGFVNMILNIILNEKPKYFVCVFDAGKHTFRHDLYADYKGKRQRMPEDLASQLPMLKQLLSSMKIKMVEMPEIEADDLVGTITRKFNAEFIVVSGDKDLFQLINDHTTCWFTQRGITNVIKLNEEELKKQYNLKPYQVVELKSIMGDSSDNIPGVPLIGEKGGKDLIEHFDTLDNIYNNIDSVPNKYKTKLEQNKELAYLSHTLATIKTDVPLDLKLDECTISLPFNRDTYEAMYDLGFKSMLNRKELFKEKFNIELKAETKISCNIVEISSDQGFDEMYTLLGDSFAMYSNSLSFNFSNKQTEYILYKNGEIFNKNLKKLQNLLQNSAQKVCFDCKTLMHELDEYGLTLNNYFDVSMAIYIANETDAEISFEDALKLNRIETDVQACTLLHLKEIYITKLINNAQLKLFSQVELPLVNVLYNMEKDGIKIDVNQIHELSKIYHDELDELVKNIYSLAGEEFNINSPKQLQVILFEKLNIPHKGKEGTSIEVLNSIKDSHPIVNLIIRYRKIAKLVNTYLDGMLPFVCTDGKIHTTFMQRTTATGRLSSREPNLQNLPIRDDEGRLLRKMFSSSFENGTIISADYNQIELRLIANFSKDENMVADYLHGKDIHTATASKIFNVPIADVTKNMRRVAKTVNFGIIYGISAYGLSQSLNCSVRDAGEFINKYMQIYPMVKKYGEDCILSARQKGYAITLMGRIRHIDEINSSNTTIRLAAERIAKNTPLQGSASDIIKVAMIRVFNKIKENNLKSKLVLQIHDELIVDCYPGEGEIIKKILTDEMQNVVNLTVPLLVEVSEGKTLFDAK